MTFAWYPKFDPPIEHELGAKTKLKLVDQTPLVKGKQR